MTCVLSGIIDDGEDAYYIEPMAEQQVRQIQQQNHYFTAYFVS